MLRIFKPAISLMNKLKYVQKFSIIFFTFLIPISIMLSLNILQVDKDYNFAKKQRIGLEYNMTLSTLIQHIQEHRGLTSVYKDGDFNSKALIENKETEINEDIKKLDNLNERYKKDLGAYSSWNQIKEQWDNLELSYNSMNSDEAFRNHSKLIQNMLSLNNLVADNSRLLIQTRLDSYALIDSIVNKLPLETEYMGQARALGAGAASRKMLSEDENIRLYFLDNTITYNLNDIINNMNKAYSNPQIKVELNNLYLDMINSANNMQNELEKEILNKKSINIDSNAYFNHSTIVINKIYELQAAESNLVNKILMDDYNIVVLKRNYLLFFTLIIILIIIYLFLGFYYSIKWGINSIEIAAESIASGKLTEKVKLEARDETQKIGNALNKMLDTLISNYNEVKAARNALETQAHFDNLTGLANRALFLEKLELMVKTSALNGKASTLLFLDLDNFKIINDTLGHAAGDVVLRTAALRLTDVVKDIGTVCRLGGDEFTVLLPNLDGISEIEQLISALIKDIEKPILINNENLSIGTSIGYAIYPRDAKDSEELLKKADTAMYKIKNQRKTNFLH